MINIKICLYILYVNKSVRDHYQCTVSLIKGALHNTLFKYQDSTLSVELVHGGNPILKQ